MTLINMKILFNKKLKNLFDRKKHPDLNGEKKGKTAKEMKEFWVNIENGIDKTTGELIWNKNVPKETFKKTDLTEHIEKKIEQHLDKIKHNNNIAAETDQMNIKLNIIFLTVYTYATSMSLVDGIIFYIGVLILSFYICYLWHNKVKNCWRLNTVQMSIIRNLQKDLPLRTHCDAEFRVIQTLNGEHHHPSFLTSMMLAKIFASLYLLTFIFYLASYFLK